jgi:hypothetical protein
MRSWCGSGPAADPRRKWFDEVYLAFGRRGTGRAMRKFVAAVGFGPPRFGTLEFWRMARLMSRIRRNMAFGLDHEIRQYPRYQTNIAVLQEVSTQIGVGWRT